MSKKQAQKSTPFLRNLYISGVLLVVAILLLAGWFVFRPNNKTEIHYLFNIETISELTTLECRYHNVAVYDKEGNWITAGKQYVWFEYDVIVDVGINVEALQIENPTKDGVVRIYLPEAEILGSKVDKATISKPVQTLGLFTNLTADEEMQIVNNGKEKLLSDDKTQIIHMANNSAKKVLEQYVVNIGKLVGKDYTVEWLKTPSKQTTSSTEEFHQEENK